MSKERIFKRKEGQAEVSRSQVEVNENAGVKRKRETPEANIEGGEGAPEKRQDGTSEAKKRFSVEQAAERSEESRETVEKEELEEELEETLRRVYDKFKPPEAQMSTPKRNLSKQMNTPTRKNNTVSRKETSLGLARMQKSIINKKDIWRPWRNTT